MSLTKCIMALAAVSAILACSCSSNKVGTVERRDLHGVPDYAADKRINFSRKMKNAFRVGSVNTVRGQNDLLMVQVDLINRTDELQVIQYRFEWTDENGMYVRTPASRWMIANVKPGDKVFLSGIAPNPKVTDFYIKLDYATK